MNNTTLLIMAAGIGSRFGGGIKQLEPVGLHNEIIMDYSIHDAIEAGFNKIVFIIRKDIENDFREVIGNRIEKICADLGVEVGYAFQSLSDIPEGFAVPEGRTKPWGTGQAVLAAKEIIHEPFMVINADDYYGKEAYRQMHDWLVLEHADNAIAMAGFILKNTLSDNGGVTRGVCKVADGHTHIVDVVETSNIIKTVDNVTGMIGASADGVELDPESYVSMNMWGFPAKEGCAPAFIDVLEKEFKTFFETDVLSNPMKAEYLLPTLIGGLLRDGKYTVKALETNDRWFGVTYKEDKESVVKSFKKLIEDGVYPQELYSDLLNR
ncbi:MAG: sugar phosphate nucleotidyltransferase [Lachnospiraceae bacterium]